MVSVIELECKKLCLSRCLIALILSINAQFFLLQMFLLFVNFHLFHLLDWITETISLMFSFRTWLYILPLILSVILYGILLVMSYLAEKRYYATRFRWLMATTPRKFLFLVIHIAVGFLTASLYARFLHADYGSWLYKCNDMDCINGKYVFLMGAGIFASCCHFYKENLYKDPEVLFPVIQERRLERIRSLHYTTLQKSPKKSFMPSLYYAVAFWLLGDMVNKRLAYFFDVEADTSLSVPSNVRLLLYSWLLSSQILSSMNLTQKLFSLLLSEQMDFPIEKSVVLAEGERDVTLVEALGMSKVPAIQNLAALNFAQTSFADYASDKRQIIFSLSLIGGHPHIWNNLYAQCIGMIHNFMEELADSVKNISTMKTTMLYCQINNPITAKVAEEILLRQYNEMHGIRRIAVEAPSPSIFATAPPKENQNVPLLATRINEKIEKMSKQFQVAFYSIPGIFYMFGEPDGAKTAFLLANSQKIIWVVDGLASISCASLLEDRYGVLQRQLPDLMRTLVKLREELEKLNNVNLNGKKLDYNLIALRSVVKRSLYRIVGTFGSYLNDIFMDISEVRSFQGYVNYTE